MNILINLSKINLQLYTVRETYLSAKIKMLPKKSISTKIAFKNQNRYYIVFLNDLNII